MDMSAHDFIVDNVDARGLKKELVELLWVRIMEELFGHLLCQHDGRIVHLIVEVLRSMHQQIHRNDMWSITAHIHLHKTSE